MLVAEGYDIGEAYWADHVELFGTTQQARRLMLRGFRVTSKPLAPLSGFAIPDDFPPGFEDYHNYAEMTANLQAFAAAHPQFVRLITLGNSYENRNIIGVRISNDANDNLSEPGVFFVGQHHAREHMTVEVTLGCPSLHQSSQVSVRSLLYSRQIYIFPSLNPDGSEYDIATGSFRMWRKNRQPNPTAVGTDNNRNFSYRWGCCGGSSGNGGSETYRGTAPLSAPENMRMSDFMVAHPNVTTGISYHTYGNLVLYPYGYTYDDLPPDMDPSTARRSSRWAPRWRARPGITHSSRPTSTSRTATGTTGCTAPWAATRSRSRWTRTDTASIRPTASSRRPSTRISTPRSSSPASPIARRGSSARAARRLSTLSPVVNLGVTQGGAGTSDDLGAALAGTSSSGSSGSVKWPVDRRLAAAGA